MKKLKLKKKVKVITTLLSFGMLLTVLPSMKLVAEDDTTTADTSDVSVGPYIKYETTEDNYYSDEVSSDTDFATLEANGGTPVATDGVTNPVVNEDGSYTYNDSVTVDKTITKETKKNTNNQDEDVYKLDMSASSLSKIVNYNAGVDYILLLDVSKNMNEENGKDRMSALKSALTTFINQVDVRSSGSRIALVQFSENSKVLTNSTGAADESALVTVKTGKENLLEIVNGNSDNNTIGLVVDSDEKSRKYSNSDKAMFDALKIFQSVSTADDHKDDLNIKYCDRTRVTILFSAGLPGLGKNDSASESASTGWDITARNSAQATMSLATILKYGEKNADGTRATKVFSDDENNSKVADSSPWSTLSANYENLSYVGCGSTVYTVGLNLDPATDPSTITTYDALNDFADISYSNRTYNVNFKIETRQAALVNEYLYRVSSHRKTGEHYLYSDYVADATLEQKLEKAFKDKYDNLPSVALNNNYYYSLKNLYGNNLYYFYPDSLTRDLNNGYFLTAKDNNLDRLTEIFNKIAQQVGSTYEGLSVRDYIDSSFVPVSIDENGVINELTEGSTLGTSSDGKYIGTLRKDQTNRWYIEWSDVKLSPESSANKGDAKTFNESIYVKPVDGIIGGNNLYTNTPDSGVYVGEENKFPFPQPSVDIPINYEIVNSDQNIYLTNSVDLADLISNKPDGITNKGVKVIYTFANTKSDFVKTLTYEAGSNQGIWSDDFSGTVGFDDGLTGDQEYVISCTVESINKSEDTLTESTSHHIHADVTDYATDKSKANINVFTPTLKYKDLDVYYEDSIPTYDDARLNDYIEWTHGSGDSKITDTAENGGISEKYKGLKPDLSKSECYSYSDGFDYTKGTTLEGKVPVKSDYRVGVTVSVNNKNITDFTSFEHVNCNDDEVMFEKNPFIVHVKTCSLTINKVNGKDGETYVFTVKKDGKDYTKASITVGSDGTGSVTISELPVGTYSIEENADLGWRYKPTYTVNNETTSEIKLPVKNTQGNVVSNDGTVTCDNANRNDQWLNKISSVVKNEFGKSHSKVSTN